ncbi:MAG: hypothetical protein ABIW76_20470 [Fibrobacteria bacterium]
MTAGSIKVTAANIYQSIKVEFTVTVTAVRVTGLVSDSLSIKVGDSLSPVIYRLPDNATDKEFTLESSTPSVAEVFGKSTLRKEGGQDPSMAHRSIQGSDNRLRSSQC